MCRVLQVSRSGYYDWKDRPICERALHDKFLTREIRKVHVESRENYGVIKTCFALKAKGINCGKHRIARLRRVNDIVCKRRKRFKITTISKSTKYVSPNRLDRCFTADDMNKAWVGDVTYIATQKGWLYLSVLLDLYSRKVIGWSMSDKNDKKLVLNALEMALKMRKPKSGIIHHTDRGSVYGSDDYRYRLQMAGLVPSMSKKGDCYDNAVAESFFSTLKNELVYGQKFVSRDHARSEIFNYIEIFYNRQRMHQTLGYVTPEAMELSCVS